MRIGFLVLLLILEEIFSAFHHEYGVRYGFIIYGLYLRYVPCGLSGGSDSKETAHSVGDQGSIPGSGRSPGEGNGYPLQYSSLRIPWTEEPGRLQSIGFQKVRYGLVTNTFHTEISKEYENVPYQKILKYLFLSTDISNLYICNFVYMYNFAHIYAYTHVHQIKVCLLYN